MYRKPRRRERMKGLDLDSLMDILSCLVGVMLFLVIYTVLELGSVAYEVEVPVVAAVPEGSDRIVVVAGNGTVRVLDVEGARGQLLSGFEIVESFDEVSVFVDAAPSHPVDDHFEYSLEFVERFSADLLGTLDMHIVEREGAVGESVAALGQGSRYDSALERLDPASAWLSFVVDSSSVDVFRRAREMAISRGFATEWNEATLDFPLVLSLSGGVDWLEELTTLTKPLR